MFSPGMSAAVTTTTFDQSKAGSSSSAEEAGVRVGRADRRAVPGAREDQVVGVLRGAGQLGGAFAPERGGAAGPAGRDRAGLDDDRAGRLGPDRQVGHGPSSWRLTLSPEAGPSVGQRPAVVAVPVAGESLVGVESLAWRRRTRGTADDRPRAARGSRSGDRSGSTSRRGSVRGRSAARNASAELASPASSCGCAG